MINCHFCKLPFQLRPEHRGRKRILVSRDTNDADADYMCFTKLDDPEATARHLRSVRLADVLAELEKKQEPQQQ